MQNQYKWYRAGDVNAFFGLMLDNIAGMVLMVSVLAFTFGFPVDFALRYMIPGTALGVLVGDMLFFWLSFRLAKKENRSDVTAMPLGLDTPSTLGMVYFVLGPAFKTQVDAGVAEFDAAMHAWQIGMCAIVITGVIKIAAAFCSNWLRTAFPRAGLLGSLAAIAICLIAFIPLTEVAENPVVGFASLVVVLVTLVSRGRLPFKIPGALGAVMLGTVLWYLMLGIDQQIDIVEDHGSGFDKVWFPTEWFAAFTFGWLDALQDTVHYLPFVIPFAIATVIGGIDCAESAASAGDDFDTGMVIGIEGVATLVAGFCGGVIQTTPYIGHPAYKAMGGRAAYVLATALFVGGAGLIGYFGFLFDYIPKAAVLPILIFIGIEITAQSFHVTPRRHYAALAIACLPAMAKLVTIFLGQYMDAINYEQIPEGDAARLQGVFQSLSVLAGGFIISSLMWASAMANIIDRRLINASLYFAVGGLLVLFGVIHSPIAGDKMFWPWQLSPEFNAWINDKFTTEYVAVDASSRKVVIEFAIAYLIMAVTVFGLGWWKKDEPPITTDEEYEQLGL